MEKIRFRHIWLFVLLFALVVGLFSLLNPRNVLDSALDAYLKGNIDESQQLLKSIEGDLPDAKFFLYESYLARAKEQLKVSDDFLRKSLQHVDRNRSREFLLEIYLNESINAYLNDDRERLRRAVEEAQEIAPADDWVVFMTGLHDFMVKDYRGALLNWETPPRRTPQSPWLKQALDQIFNPFWFSMQIIRCQIELGDYITARQALEQESKGTLKLSQKEQIDYLLGLSYLKEALAMPLQAATPYFRLAASNFDKLKTNKDEWVIDSFRDEALKLIKDNSLKDIGFYLSVTDKWQATSAKIDIEQSLIKLGQQAIADSQWEKLETILTLLNTSKIDPQKTELLSAILWKALLDRLGNGDVEGARKSWNALKILENQEVYQKNLRDALHENILNLIQVDTDQLENVTPYLQWDESLHNAPNGNMPFFRELQFLIKSLWLMPGQSLKALALLKIMSKQYQTSEEGKERLELLLKWMYTTALQEKRVELVSPLLEEAKILTISSSALTEKTNLKDILAEAQILYQNQNYEQALDRIEWVIHIDPQNVEGLTLAGMIYYDQLNYAQAKKFLEQIESSDPKIVEALNISNFILSKNGTILPEASADGNLRLGYKILATGDWWQAISTLSKVPASEIQGQIGIFYGYMQLKKYEKAAEVYNTFPQNIKNLSYIRGMHILLLNALGNKAEANQKFDELMQPQVNESFDAEQFGLYFLHFQKQMQAKFIPAYISAMLYESSNNYNQALNVLKEIKNPSPFLTLEKGRLQVELDQIKEATATLNYVRQQLQGEPEDEILQKSLLELEAQYLEKQGRFEDAWSVYQRLNPHDKSLAYAALLVKLRRFDQALEIYQPNLLLPPEHIVNKITSYINTNHFEKGEELAHQVYPSLPLLYRLKLADQLIITSQQGLIQKTIQDALQAEELSKDEYAALINLWTDLGIYSQAYDLSKKVEPILASSPEGLLTLSRLLKALSMNNDAAEMVKKAIQLNPFDMRLMMALDGMTADADTLAFWEENLKNDPESISYKIGLAHHLLAKISASELNQSYHLLNNLASQIKELPMLYFLLGKALLGLANYSSAETAFNDAIKLDSSYSDVYLLLGLTLEQTGNLFKASDFINKALKFTPWNAQAWEQLARLNEKDNNFLETLNNLQTAIKYQPNNSLLYLKLASVTLGLNNPEGAIQALKDALKKDPKNPEVLKALLVALYDPNLQLDAKSIKALKAQRETIFQSLHELDPVGSDALINRLNSQQNN